MSLELNIVKLILNAKNIKYIIYGPNDNGIRLLEPFENDNEMI